MQDLPQIVLFAYDTRISELTDVSLQDTKHCNRIAKSMHKIRSNSRNQVEKRDEQQHCK